MPELSQDQAPQAEHADRVAAAVVAILDAVSVHVAQRLNEPRPECSPALNLWFGTAEPVDTGVPEDEDEELLTAQLRTVLVGRVACPLPHPVLHEDRRLASARTRSFSARASVSACRAR